MPTDFIGPAVRETESGKDVLRGYTNAFEGDIPRLHQWFAARQNGNLRFFSEVEKENTGPPPPCDTGNPNNRFSRNCRDVNNPDIPPVLPATLVLQPPEVGPIFVEPSGELRWFTDGTTFQRGGPCDWEYEYFPTMSLIGLTLQPFDDLGSEYLGCQYTAQNSPPNLPPYYRAGLSFNKAVSIWELDVTYFGKGWPERWSVTFNGTLNAGLSRDCLVPPPQGLYTGSALAGFSNQVHWRAQTVG